MRKRKILSVLLTCVVATSLLVGCGGTSAKENSATSSETSADSSTLVMNGDYVVPPTSHGNPFIGGYVGGGLEPYLQDNLFVYAAFPGEFKGHLGESYTFENGVLTIKIKEGLKWSDGSDLTAKDVETSYYMNVGKRQIWDYLDTINVIDDTTLELNFKTESPLVVNMAFDIKMAAPDTVYGEWAEKYKEVATTGREYHPETGTFWYSKEANDKLGELNSQLEEVKPKTEEMVCSGPYTVKAITTSEALLTENENYRQDLDIDNIKVVRVITPETAAAAMVDGTLDIHSGGIVRDMEDQLIKKIEDYKAYYVSEFSQMSLVFNTQKYPASEKGFRQALAYLVNKDEVMPLTEPGSLTSETTLSGLPVTLQESWGLKEFAEKELENYSYNPEKAEEILTSMGWKRNNDGIWANEKGEVVKFEIAANNGWGSAMLPGESIVTRLQEFGFDVQFKPMEGSAYGEYFTKQEHTIAIEFAPTGNVLYAHPYGTYEALYKSRPFLMGLTPNEEGQIIINGTNVTELVNKLFTAKDDEVTELTKQLMKITNDEALFIPYLEKGFPVRVLKDSVVLEGATPDETIKDVRFSGVGPDLFATLIKENTIKLNK